ncbi:hypothetical protein BDV95DRAFT_607369 [Massariosphaeria phaeospora]|uniref:DUF7730 domain-containing protein n=1 Tax=Massariosphaeria phaeospora TaxID=100035 RepID=A0A7C8IEG2_9PLEO|nr:hypothetical protein BDV95DRAFT_607369 [Massariosphaeria phaeospora]
MSTAEYQAEPIEDNVGVVSNMHLEPSGDGRSNSHLHDDPTSQLPTAAATTPSKTETITFLTLPVEMRLEVYELLLVNRSNETAQGWETVGTTNQKKIPLDEAQPGQDQGLEPAILRTCKQIYKEARSVLYSRNAFIIAKPREAHYTIMKCMERDALSSIKTMHLWVSYASQSAPDYVPVYANAAEKHQWFKLLKTIRNKATGLRHLEIALDANIEAAWSRGWASAACRGHLGGKSMFKHVLRKIQGLESFVLRGYYAKDWPEYFEEHVGIPVQGVRGLGCAFDRHVRIYYYGDKKDPELAHLLRDKENELFDSFQQRNSIM